MPEKKETVLEFLNYLKSSDNDPEKSDQAINLIGEHLKYFESVHVDEEYALRICSYFGLTNAVKRLHDNGAHIKAYSDAPIRLACQGDNIDTVKFLIDNGADINAENGAPIQDAAESGNAILVKLLIANGATVTKQAIEAAKDGKHESLAGYLEAVEQKGNQQNVLFDQLFPQLQGYDESQRVEFLLGTIKMLQEKIEAIKTESQVLQQKNIALLDIVQENTEIENLIEKINNENKADVNIEAGAKEDQEFSEAPKMS